MYVKGLNIFYISDSSQDEISLYIVADAKLVIFTKHYNSVRNST